MSEIELKFGVDPKRAAAIDAALRRLASKRASIRSHYYDTDDRRLAEAGLALRLRQRGNAWEQTLKAPGASAVDRQEETVPRPGKWGPVGPPIYPALHAGTAASRLLDAALSQSDSPGAPLRPLYSSVITRRAAEVGALGARVEVAFDRGVIRAGANTVPVCEIEYELKSGDPRALIEFGRAGIVEQGLWLSTISKAARGDQLAHGHEQWTAVKAQAPHLERATSGAQILQALMRVCLDQIVANASIVAAGHYSEEAIHQLRVGLRRIRTVARELGALSSALDRTWEGPFATAFRALGAYRDRVTVAKSMHSRLSAAGSPEPTLPQPTSDAPDPVEVIRNQDFQCALLDALGHTLAPPSAGSDADAGDALQVIGARLAKLHRQLARGAKTFENLDEGAQHRVRKRLKRLRYLAELVGPLYDPRKVERYLAKLRPAQDALGAYVDVLVAHRMAQDAADAGDAKAWFNVGWFSAQMPASAKRCGKVLVRASKARRFW